MTVLKDYIEYKRCFTKVIVKRDHLDREYASPKPAIKVTETHPHSAHEMFYSEEELRIMFEVFRHD